jgi:hypothetical protein
VSIAYQVRYTEVVTGDYIPNGAVIEFAPSDGDVNGDGARLASRYAWLMPDGKVATRATCDRPPRLRIGCGSWSSRCAGAERSCSNAGRPRTGGWPDLDPAHTPRTRALSRSDRG